MMLGSRPRSCIRRKSSSAVSHCLPFSQAEIVVLYVMTFGSTPHCFISLKSSSAVFQSRSLSAAEIAQLKVKTSCSMPFARVCLKSANDAWGLFKRRSLLIATETTKRSMGSRYSFKWREISLTFSACFNCCKRSRLSGLFPRAHFVAKEATASNVGGATCQGAFDAGHREHFAKRAKRNSDTF